MKDYIKTGALRLTRKVNHPDLWLCTFLPQLHPIHL